MRFLVDENLPPRLAQLLTDHGHDAVHVRDIGARSSPDSHILALADADERIIVSADTDFGALLAQNAGTSPSVILVRELVALRPDELAAILARQVPVIADPLSSGAIIAVTRRGVRVRRLPLR